MKLQSKRRVIMAKTLIDFRAEKGLYLKDVAIAIDISEEELTKIETLNGIPDYIAEKLIVAYNLPEDYFSGEKVEQSNATIKNLKSYFFKTSLVWHFLFALVFCIPIWIEMILKTVIHLNAGTLGLTVFEQIFDNVNVVFTAVVTIVYCNMFAKHIMKKTGLKGDIYKYKYLYEVIPSGAIAVVSVFTGLITTIALKETIADESKYYLMPIVSAIGFVISIISMVLIALATASLLNTAILEDSEQKAKRHKTMAIIVTISSVLAFALTIVSMFIEENPTVVLTIIRGVLVYGLYIAVAWRVYLTKDEEPQKEFVAFTLLPLSCIVDSIVFEIIGL